MNELIQGLGVADVVDTMNMDFPHRSHIIHLDSPDPDKVCFECYGVSSRWKDTISIYDN